MLRLPLTFALLFVVLLAACSSQGSAVSESPTIPTEATLPLETTQPAAPTTTRTSQPTPVETESPLETETSTETDVSPLLSFEAATYRDETTGFELDYPTEWNLSSQQETGPRGSIAQLSQAGEPRLDIVVLQWDPKNDLNAFVQVRKQAWEASGFTLLSEEEVQLKGDLNGLRFVVQTQEEEQGFFFFAPVGTSYLQLSGTGDLALLAEISQTVRTLGSGEPLDISAGEPCLATEAEPLDWVICNLVDALRSRNLAVLPGYMSDPFVLGYWASEFRSATPTDTIAELAAYRLPADPASPITFTTDREKFPPLAGIQPERMFGPEVDIAQVIYSEGWEPDGAGAALLFIALDVSGDYTWHGMVYSDGHFDK